MRSCVLDRCLRGTVLVSFALPVLFLVWPDFGVEHRFSLRFAMQVLTCVVVLLALWNARVKWYRPWWILAASAVVGAVAEGMQFSDDTLDNLHAEIVALISFALGLCGLTLLANRWARFSNLAIAVDTLIMTTAVMVLFGALAYGPLSDPDSPPEVRFSLMALLLLDLAYVVVVARVLFSPASTVPAIGFLLVAQIPLFIEHAVAFIDANAWTVPPERRWVLWFFFYPLSMMAHIHPSVARRPTKLAPTTFGLHRGQGAVLTLCLLLPAITLALVALSSLPLAWEIIVAGSVVVTLLVVARMAAVFRVADRQRAELERLARFDSLTSAPNRHAWESALRDTELVHQAGGCKRWLALIDVDHFKHFNDTHGHQAGDQFLVDAVAAWRSELSGDDLLARYGGEEFSLMVSRDSAEGVEVVLEALRAAVPGEQSCSIGVAEWEIGETAGDVMYRADMALYAAKGGGRNQVVWGRDVATPTVA